MGLADLQAWFGGSIAIPLPDEYPGNPLEISAPAAASEADGRLRAKGGMSGFARLGVYNQQYWFRLVSIMQADYACAIHLMGLHPFNAMAVRYLTDHPPASPFLAELDKDFPAYLAANYQGPERSAVLQAIAYERALSKAFDAEDGETLADAGLGPEALMTTRLRLAPHVTPVHVDWDFAEYRSRCSQDESLEADVGPPVPGPADLVIHRDASLDVLKEPVPAAALALLRAFPGTLGEVFAELEGKLAPADQAALESGLGSWFQAWVAEGWLCLDREPAGI
jgi:hypothetical protein